MRKTAITLSCMLLMMGVCASAQNASKHQYVDLGLSVKWATTKGASTEIQPRYESFAVRPVCP